MRGTGDPQFILPLKLRTDAGERAVGRRPHFGPREIRVGLVDEGSQAGALSLTLDHLASALEQLGGIVRHAAALLEKFAALIH